MIYSVQIVYASYVLFISIIFALLEAFFYKNYGKFRKKQWIRDSQYFSEYHTISWYLFMGTAILFPVILIAFVGTGSQQIIKMFFTFLGMVFVSGVVEDRLFFVFTKHPFNSKNVSWWRWLRIGKLQLPRCYIIDLLLGIAFLVLSAV